MKCKLNVDKYIINLALFVHNENNSTKEFQGKYSELFSCRGKHKFSFAASISMKLM